MRQIAFGAEEASNPRAYPPGYRARSLDEQLSRLRQLLPRLTVPTRYAEPASLPDGAEAWFAIPDWRAVAGTYNAAVSEVLGVLARERATSFSRLDRLGPAQLRQMERTAAMSAQLTPLPGSSIIAVAAQCGARHKGRSIRHARERFVPHEFGLGAFAVACVLLTHPERLAVADQLYVDCAGDEYTSSDEPQYTEAPYFRMLDGRVGFGTSWIGYPDPYFGSATAFLPG